MRNEAGRTTRRYWNSPSGSARRHPNTFASVLVVAALVAASCAKPQLVITAPPDPPDAAFDVWDDVPKVWQDWYENDYDPWADAVCRAIADPNVCATFDEESPEA